MLNASYNTACHTQSSLNNLFRIRGRLAEQRAEIGRVEPVYGPFRQGDVRHSLADISKARKLLGYEPAYQIEEGLNKTTTWFLSHNQ